MIIISSVSCIYGIGAVETYAKMTEIITNNQNIDRNSLLKRLVELQYTRNDTAFYRGIFRVKGDVIEIFPSHLEDRAWRLSMFGDEIESIWEIDPLTGEKIETLDQVIIYPNSHYVTPRPTILQAIPKIKMELKEVIATVKLFRSIEKRSMPEDGRSGLKALKKQRCIQ